MNRAFVVLACCAGLLLVALLLLRGESTAVPAPVDAAVPQIEDPISLRATNLEELSRTGVPAKLERSDAQHQVPEVQGKLLDAEGLPALGATVRLYAWVEGPETASAGYVERGRRSTMDRGRFEFAEAPSEPWIVVAYVEASGPSTGYLARSARQRGPARDLTLHLRGDLPCRVRIVDEQGRPLPVDFQLSLHWEDPLADAGPWAWNSGAGELRLAVFPGEFEFTAEAQDFAPTTRRVRFPGPTVLDFQMDNNGSIVGTLRTSDGQLASDLEVELTDSLSPRSSPLRRMKTAENGQFQFREVPPGDYLLTAWRRARERKREDGFVALNTQVSLHPRKALELDLHMPRGAVIEGVALAVATGEEIALYDTDPRGIPLCTVPLNAERRFQFQGLRAGAYVVVSRRNHSPVLDPVPVELGHDATRMITLGEPMEGATLRGAVTYPDGRAAAATVHAYDLRFSSSRGKRGTFSCGPDGSFSFPMPESSELTLVATIDGDWGGEAQVRPSDRQVRIQLRPTGRVECPAEWTNQRNSELPGLWVHWALRLDIRARVFSNSTKNDLVSFPWPEGTWSFEGSDRGIPRTASLEVVAGETVHIREALLTPGHASKR